MDASVKQRLVGATVLVVLAVIFLPMVFDGSEESRTESIDLGIPAEPDRDFETRVVPLDAPGRAAAPAPDPGAIVTVDADAPDRPDALAGTNAAPATAPAAPPPVGNAPTPATATADAPRVDAAPATAAPTPAEPTAAPPTNAGGRYAVSFGSYARADNARTLVASLRKAGIEARAEDVDVNGQPGMRVRAGPFVDRAQAEQVRLLAKRARADVPGTIIEIDEAAADATAPATPASAATSGAPTGLQRPGSAWAVQVAAYQAETDATSQRDKLRASGFSAYVDTIRTETGTMHRVRVGPETQRANAEMLRGSLKAKLGLDGLVVRHP